MKEPPTDQNYENMLEFFEECAEEAKKLGVTLNYYFEEFVNDD